MMPEFLDNLTRAVQHNCHVADARHAADLGMCTYLLKMREYFRWEKGLGFHDRLASDEVGEWLSTREAHWETLLDADFEPIRIEAREYDPFDADAINEALEPLKLVYSGGLIGAGKPHFFLARLERVDKPSQSVAIRVCNTELARGLSAPPAMTREHTIFLRREALRRYLWERMEIWRWQSPKNALARAFAVYDFENDLDGALDRMTEIELQTVLHHEIGEVEATRLLGEEWHDMLRGLLGTPAELMARAVRDYIADCLSTLPHLVRQGEAAPVHFFIGALSNMRKDIFPGLIKAYEEWEREGDFEPFTSLAGVGWVHWSRVAAQMMGLYRLHGHEASGPIAELVNDSRL